MKTTFRLPEKISGEIMLVGVTILAALGWFISKSGIQYFPPAGFLAIRFIGAAWLFLPFSWRAIQRLSFKQWMVSFCVGVAFSANIFLWIQGVSHSQYFGEGAFLLSLSMLFAPILSWIIFWHKPSRLLGISLLIAAVGVYFLNAGRPLWQMSLGSALFAASSFCGALFFVLNNQFSRLLPILPLTTLQLAIAGVICGLYSWLFETWQSMTPTAIGWAVLAILLITNARFLLQTTAQKRCAIGNAAMIMVLEPVWTVILSVGLLGETFTWQKMVGGGLILIAILIYRLPTLFGFWYK
jgi:hypothetical protein